MHRHLYFICPTDHLEPIINNTFKQENYYISSLGNSIEFDSEMAYEVNELLDSKRIMNISFALSQNNSVLEAMEKKYAGISGLTNLQNKLKRQKKYAQEIWDTNDPNFLAISYHLNDKIRELSRVLNHLRIDTPKINGIIYSRLEGRFKSPYSNLMYENNVSVN